ncbi:type II secretion system F family protein [Glaciihabitans sp. dw_435]|uniref:type II secretion system F family protein n=1 Tax=Glaciihabitans sp. dw_435 TaxID=2720081 RepID=UPI001BD4B1FA|nr:type II secretion system F family protein [Glaciihabitans sp. dw_435]
MTGAATRARGRERPRFKWRARSRARAPDIAAVASVVQRLAVLLRAGVAPAGAWEYLRADGPAGQIAAAVASGQAIPDAIAAAADGRPDGDAGAWRGLAAAWAVASEAGAPLAPTLRDFARSLRSLAEAQRDIAVALSAPVSTARMVMVLPVIGVLFGMVLGFNTVATLFATPVGLVCLVVGGGLLAAAAGWNRRLVRSAQPRDLTPGLTLDLVAIAVSGGSPVDRARELVRRCTAQYGLVEDPSAARIDEVLDLSQRAGVPAAELLRSEADDARRAARAEVQQRAAQLAVRLMLPLGLCILPAFMVLGVLPLLVAVVTSTVGSF